MTQYRVQWNYASGIGGPWAKGETVELDEARAVAISQDSPGVLVEVGQIEATPIPEARDRMVRRAKRRGQDGSVEAIDRTTFKAVKET